MASLNRVFLIGNLTRDPELRYTPGGAPVASFGMAINTQISKPNGESKEDVCFVRVVVWGKQGENCKQYLAKGRLVFVEGRLIYRSWEQEGKTRSTLEVRADRVQFLSSRREEAAAGAPEPIEELVPSESTGSGGGEAPASDEPPF